MAKRKSKSAASGEGSPKRGGKKKSAAGTGHDQGDAARHADQLRRQAEAKIAGLKHKVASMSPKELRTLTHELQVHQVELEMQTEELRRTEAELTESRDRYAELYDFAPLGCFGLDAEGQITEASLSGAELLGVERAELIGRPLADFISPESRESFYRHRKQVTASGTLHICEVPLEKTEGGRLYVELRSVRARSAQPRAGHIRVVMTDISERKRMEDALLASEERLRQREAELARIGRLHVAGELAAGLAHEINQPLYAVTNFVEGALRRLKKGITDPAELAPVFEQALQEAKRASEIIARLRQLVRNRVATTMSTTDVNDLVRSALELVKPEAKRHRASVETEFAEGLPSLVVDSVQVEQVVLNLVGNALDAMADVPRGLRGRRTLTVATSMFEERAVEVAVRDTGPGVAPDAAETVFEPFYTTKPDGLGMGLSISRSIVEAHGGRIWIEPNPPQGTTVRFTLPLPEKEPGHAS